ncbi:MAG: aspartate--tRNA ligase [Planctomycetota bacterium]|jgi:aspartyl-tRNA synthetase
MLRTQTCGELTAKNEGETTTLIGWVDAVRDHGGVGFVDLRDRYGRTQITLNPEELGGPAPTLRSEQVLRVIGTVELRPEGMRNPKLTTGDVEVRARSVEIIGDCPPLPFDLSEIGGGEITDELRYRYRFLDMRRDSVKNRFLMRSDLLHQMRNFLHAERFVELETPVLTKSTPEGARDFLVPSRLNHGEFYALPQSPQIFKQIFMVAGFDRYMQVVRCFRDEDLRADRQPEFTQLDLELACVEEDDVIDVVERMVAHLIREISGVTVTTPFPRLSYKEAVSVYGTDAPDLRSPLRLETLDDLVDRIPFNIFTGAVEAGGQVKALRVPGGGAWSRKVITELEALAKTYGAGGLAWVKTNADGWVGPLSRFLEGEALELVAERTSAEDGDLLLFVADGSRGVVNNALNALRKEIARREGHSDPAKLAPCWVTEFPLFESDDDGNPTPCHHPFTSPHPEDADRLESEPLTVRARAYDLVLNGFEIGGGSIRIHQRELQERVFRRIGLSSEEANEKFSFLLEALKYGAPPHGGIALGIDRLAMILAGDTSIREVIAFPKTQRGGCPLTGAPGEVASAQLEEIGLRISPRATAQPESGAD